jgi:membrane protein implicated in regulation of membrane protease activity
MVFSMIWISTFALFIGSITTVFPECVHWLLFFKEQFLAFFLISSVLAYLSALRLFKISKEHNG